MKSRWLTWWVRWTSWQCPPASPTFVHRTTAPGLAAQSETQTECHTRWNRPMGSQTWDWPRPSPLWCHQSTSQTNLPAYGSCSLPTRSYGELKYSTRCQSLISDFQRDMLTISEQSNLFNNLMIGPLTSVLFYCTIKRGENGSVLLNPG